MQFAALRALQRLANGRGCYMLVSTGCVHGALTLMRRDPTDRTKVMMCMDIPRALLVNPLCAIRARKTKGALGLLSCPSRRDRDASSRPINAGLSLNHDVFECLGDSVLSDAIGFDAARDIADTVDADI